MLTFFITNTVQSALYRHPLGMSNLDDYVDTVTSYISFCEDLCITQKRTKSFNNNKPWFSPELKIKLQEKEIAFQSGDRSNYKRTMYEWRRCVNLAKSDYKSRLEKQFIDGDTRSVWQGLQTITGYKKKPTLIPSDDFTANSLNQFYARFDRDNNTPVTSTLDPEVNIPQPFFIENHEVCNMFKRQNIRKSAGPDGVSTATLKHCANELAPLFRDIFLICH